MTPTPNPTAEAVQKLREAVFAQSQRERDKCATGSGLYYPSIEAAETIIRAVGLLSEGAPSEEQIERAAKAYLNGGIYTLESDGEHHARMRAALTAAGVAPQELTEECTCPSGNGSLRWPCPSHPPAPSPDRENLIAEAQKAVWAEIHGQDARRTYSAAEVKRLIYALDNAIADALEALTTRQEIDAPSVREAIGEVLADMEAVIDGVPVASDLVALTEIADAAIRAATSAPSRTAKRTGYETVASAGGEHSQKITVRAALTTPQEAKSAAKVVPVSYEASASCSHGVCPAGCSHLMWSCSSCSCEGGWGASREQLEKLAAKHECPPAPQEGDARERLHAKCDCVPDLGPAHCHLCSNENGSPVPWPECSAVRALCEAAKRGELSA